jgi:hypothetical protein
VQCCGHMTMPRKRWHKCKSDRLPLSPLSPEVFTFNFNFHRVTRLRNVPSCPLLSTHQSQLHASYTPTDMRKTSLRLVFAKCLCQHLQLQGTFS